jgi:Tfp pilus assembly protein PilO
MIIERFKKSKLPTRSIAFLLVCAGGLLTFFILVIYPQRISLAEADLEIEKLKDRIEEQKILYPVFQDLLRKEHIKVTEGLPFPEKAKMKRDDTAKIWSIFQEIAQKSGLTLEDIVPDVSSLIGSSGYFKMNLVVKGEFFDLRNFFLQLGELPYLEHIEKIRIRPVQNAKEIRLILWMAQE